MKYANLAFWLPLVFIFCPSSPQFQLRCLAHFCSHNFGSDVHYMFCRICFTFRGPEGLEDPKMSFLFHFLLFSYDIKPILLTFLGRIPSWDEIIWSPLTLDHYKRLDLPTTRLLLKPMIIHNLSSCEIKAWKKIQA